MTDVVLHPAFPADEFEKWKARQRGTIEQAKSQPATLSSEVLMKVLYPNDARRFTRITAESLDKITRENLIEHYKKYYVPSGDWAGLVGDITPRDAAAKLDKALGGWKGGPVEAISLPIDAPIAEKKVYLVSRPGSVQTDLTLARIASTLSGEGLSLKDVVSCTVYLADKADFRAFNEAYARHFSDPLPVRTTVQAELMLDARAEIMVIAQTRG